MSQRRACKAAGQHRSTQQYVSKSHGRTCELTARMVELSRENPRYGYRRIHALLLREGWQVNRKRVQRIWRREGLKVPSKQRKRRRVGSKDGSCVRHAACHPNHVWSLDFVFDQTACGRQVKTMALVDEFTRECLALPASRSFRCGDVIDTIAAQVARRGAPRFIRSDNGPEFVAQAIRDWTATLAIGTLYIEPGAPWQNAYAESFNGKLRDELLDREVFDDLAHARQLLAEFKDTYNRRRPHSSLGNLTPAEFAATWSDRLGPSALADQTKASTDTLTLIGGGR